MFLSEAILQNAKACLKMIQEKKRSQPIMSITEAFLSLLLQVYNTFLHCLLFKDLLSLSSPQAPVIRKTNKNKQNHLFFEMLAKEVFCLHSAPGISKQAVVLQRKAVKEIVMSAVPCYACRAVHGK